MTWRRRCTVIAAVTIAMGTAAAAPGASAQSPGDSQYQDPFPSTQSSGGGGSSGNTASSGRSNVPGGDSAPLRSAPPAQSGGSGAVSQTSRSGASGRQLAATGADVGLVALAGAGMLLAGIGLRLREPGA